MVKNYIFFAIISILLNLFSQYIFLKLYDGFHHLYLALCFGTFVGLISKYIFDKVYIFKSIIVTKKNEILMFILYSFTGIFTTFIFWGIEISFDYIFQHDLAKYFGGFIGLIIGYSVKFYLDKKFVFTN
jgi:putative flippase GtrA